MDSYQHKESLRAYVVKGSHIQLTKQSQNYRLVYQFIRLVYLINNEIS